MQTYKKNGTVQALVLLFVAVATTQLFCSVHGRYLPTRSQDDRLDKLRELLKDLLETDMERKGPSGDYGELMSMNHVGPLRPAALFKRSTTGMSDKGPIDALTAGQNQNYPYFQQRRATV